MNMPINNVDSQYIELERILSEEDISTVFQPIVSLKSGKVIGYECLTRGPLSSELHSPEKLFNAAERYKKVWELELLCRVKAIERAKDIDKEKFLFINVDPLVLKDDKFTKGFTKEFLAKYHMSPETIIFEITERTSIEDYRTFKAALENYVEQGYKIAIDDTGSGYSGLKMLTETKPHFVKIDMDIIRNIDRDTFKQALIKCFVALADVTGMKLIAEGIETEAELITLIDMGVYAGQGFFLQRPAGTFLELSENIQNIITNYNKLKDNNYNVDSKNYIGQIARLDRAFSYDTSCGEIKKYFEKNNYTGACIVKNDRPIGLIMDHNLNSAFATQYGLAVFSKRPVTLVMDKDPLIVDYYASITEVSKAAMMRSNENIYDYVIVTKENKYFGLITIRNLLEYKTALENSYARKLNPLTGLPGNTLIEAYLKDMLGFENECCVLYLDLDNFKAYNDNYGFENGDKILKLTADIIQKAVRKTFPYNSFIGHVGGDDFVCVINGMLEKINDLCMNIIDNFDGEILKFFNEKDRENGFIEAVDRKGNKEIFSLTAISIAGINKNLSQYSNVDELSMEMSSIKKEIKRVKGSSFLIRS